MVLSGRAEHVKGTSPLLGFNNNVKHKGRVFHIQTEDSGIKHPHVITHLFADGGRILKTTKTSYAEHVGAPALPDTVRQMMQEQHKAMFIALRDGQFDHLFEPLSGTAGPNSAKAAASAPVPRGDPAPPVSKAPPVPVSAAAPPTEAAPATAPATVVTEPAADAAAAAAAASPEPRRPSRPPPPGKKRSSVRPPPRKSAPPDGVRVVSPLAPTMELPAQADRDADLHALERAAKESQQSYVKDGHALPPPPAAVLGRATPVGTYRSVTPLQGTPPIESKPAAPGGRYAPARPAAIFANSRPQEGASIFGEDLISEKSLDEVILSYLAEDLDTVPPKK